MIFVGGNGDTTSHTAVVAIPLAGTNFALSHLRFSFASDAHHNGSCKGLASRMLRSNINHRGMTLATLVVSTLINAAAQDRRDYH